ncbi:RVP_2 domain-containing protein [Senna tora]|uniref:RVP_2 domain-containing protein n=1 Tax=Senna tora TaxID=362788 RepID=A0A834X065_9FABA|nr:RVP_2 domain-containing protein [Senna tora]
MKAKEGSGPGPSNEPLDGPKVTDEVENTSKWVKKQPKWTKDYSVNTGAFVELMSMAYGSNTPDLTALKQLVHVNDVADYQDKFKAFSTCILGLSEHWLVSMFVGGLKEYLQFEINPIILQLHHKLQIPHHINGLLQLNCVNVGLRGCATTTSRNITGIRKLKTEEQEEEDVEVIPEISFNALEGQFHPSTLRVTRKHKDFVVKVLIENGSTHNFIKSNVASKLQLQLTAIKPFKVQTRNGAYLECADIVLGVQGFAKLGGITINHKELTMSFVMGDEEVSTENAFTDLKQKMTQASILVLPNFQKTFVVETNASNIGIGVMLSQDGHPVAFFISHEMVPLLVGEEIHGHDRSQECEGNRKNEFGCKSFSRHEDTGIEMKAVASIHILTKARHAIFEAIKMANQANEEFKELHHTTYHLKTDGQSEVVNRCVQQYLPAYASDQPKKWSEYLVWVELCVDAVDELIREREKLQQALRGHLLEVQERMESIVDKKREDRAVAYKLSLTEDSRIHLVFHVSYLKAFKGTSQAKEGSGLGPSNEPPDGPKVADEAENTSKMVKKPPKWAKDYVM